MFSGYIPTSSLLSLFGLEQYTDNSAAKMKIQVFNLAGNLYSIKGVSEFTLQHNPATLNNPEIKANYASHTALGMSPTKYHYLNTTTGDAPFEFIIEDGYEGTPHSRVDAGGNVVKTDFLNLFEVVSWIDSLSVVISEWGRPPFVRISLGRYSVFGFVSKVDVQWLRLQRNAEASIAKVTLNLTPDTINVSSDKAFFEVS